MATIKNTQTEILELKNTVTELKNSTESFNGRLLNHAKERMRDLEDRTLKTILSERKKERRKIMKTYRN